MKLQGFSYSKLTELQVQGARERSSRQIEISQRTRQLEQVQQKWLAQLKGGDISQEVYCEVIIDAFSQDREISPFMVARLANLCRREHQAVEFEKGVDKAHLEHRDAVQWMYEEMDKAGKDKIEMVQDLTTRVEAMKEELKVVKEKKMTKEFWTREFDLAI